MNKAMQATPVPIEEYRQLNTCVVASAIETFNVRLRNQGFTDASVRCIFPEFSPMAGYAATARIRSAEPPMEGHTYYPRTDWWNHILTVPAPRIIVVQDIDERPGTGAFIGEVQANILKALDCVGLVTNGAVRDVPRVKEIRFHFFAGNISVSHAYAHVFDFGGPVQVGGLKVQPGDLLQGDIHGVQTIPRQIANQVPAKAREIMNKRERLIHCCRDADFSLTKLQQTLKEVRS